MYRIENFKAGNIKNYFANWHSITSDPETLQTVNGLPIEFFASRPENQFSQNQFSMSEITVLKDEINKLLKKGVVTLSSHEENEYISPIFLVPKEDNAFRMILNLKRLNEYIPYLHFKMDTFDKVLTLIRPNCFMCTVDIKDAYYSVAIHEPDQKYLKFKFQNNLYKFVCLPNGLSTGPRKFTKLLKPVLSFLREKGYIVSAYIDDILIIDYSFDSCIAATIDTIKLLNYLGFVIQPSKSQFIPKQCVTYLGFIINSATMKVTLPSSKIQKIKQACLSLHGSNTMPIRDVASVVGLIVSAFPAVKFGPLHYRALECCKIEALKSSHGNFDHAMSLSNSAYEDLD